MNASSDGGLSPRQCSTAAWRQWVVLASAALLTVTPAHAQTGPGCFANVCLPNEFEVGVGVLDDRILRGSPAVFLLGLSFISSEWPLDCHQLRLARSACIFNIRRIEDTFCTFTEGRCQFSVLLNVPQPGLNAAFDLPGQIQRIDGE